MFMEKFLAVSRRYFGLDHQHHWTSLRRTEPNADPIDIMLDDLFSTTASLNRKEKKHEAVSA